MNTTIQSIGIVLLCAAAAGCSTPQPVRDLAVHGAAISEQADKETRAFLARAERSREARAERIEAFADEDLSADASIKFNNWVAEQAGVEHSQRKIDLVQSLADHSRAAREEAQQKIAELHKKFDATPVSPDAASKALADTKKSFVVLAQELSPGEWAAFSWKYLKQVRDAYRADDSKNAAR